MSVIESFEKYTIAIVIYYQENNHCHDEHEDQLHSIVSGFP